VDIEGFWQLIERSREISQEQEQHHHLRALLGALPVEGILTFDRIFAGYTKLSYRGVLWAAFSVMHGGCSDDWFEYYRYELIAAGREVFDAVVTDPDRLAETTFTGFYGYPDIGYAARRAYEQATGVELFTVIGKYAPFDMDAECRRIGLDPHYRLDDDPIMTVDFDDGDVVKQFLPNVWRRYGRG
jgi:hypothetical protein